MASKTSKRGPGRPVETSENQREALDIQRIRLTKAQAERLELDNRQRRRELLEADDVKDAWEIGISNCRARILQLPNKILPEIQQAASYAEAEIAFKRALTECLEELTAFDLDKLASKPLVDDEEEIS
jgi:hypothetical protein